jgi:hypothetical protein
MKPKATANQYRFKLGKAALRIKPGEEFQVKLRWGSEIFKSAEDAKNFKPIQTEDGIKSRDKVFFLDPWGQGWAVGVKTKSETYLVSGGVEGALKFATDDRKCWLITMMWVGE